MQNSNIDRAVSRLTDTGVVPLDEIYALTAEGVDFSELDRKYNINNQDLDELDGFQIV